MQDLFSDDDISQESVEDVHTSANDLKNAVLYNTDWTVETIVNQIAKGRIDLSPEFQRREAWGLKAKSLLIESIILNFPVPPVTLAERGREGVFLVVDGKQRLSSISQFLGHMPSSKFNNFKLVGLTQLDYLNGFSFKEIATEHPKDATALENYSIRTNVIRGWHDDTVLFSIFHRLNSGSVKLSPQELRQSLHPGPFSKFIDTYCETSAALREIFPGIEPDFRMRDIELAIRFIGLALFMENYSGDLKKHLDETVDYLNNNWQEYKDKVAKILARMEKGYKLAKKAFGEGNLFKKWNVDKWESRTNRAVFDAIMFATLNDHTLKAFEESPEVVVDAFKKASLKEAFKDAVEKTTKTTSAVFSRIQIFCQELKEVGIDSPTLKFENNRIYVEKI